jgi:hypothetical protein
MAHLNMIEITKDTHEIVKHYFHSEEHQREVIQYLQRDCSSTIWERATPVEMERLWFSVLKLSKGNFERLVYEISEAQKDYRDVLMAADFGIDVEEHRKWADDILTSRSSKLSGKE